MCVCVCVCVFVCVCVYTRHLFTVHNLSSIDLNLLLPLFQTIPLRDVYLVKERYIDCELGQKAVLETTCLGSGLP